jgi:hypothetical protein
LYFLVGFLAWTADAFDCMCIPSSLWT